MVGVNRAILPAAGYGMRLRPITRAIPKEMLPIGRKPVLEYVIEELKTAKISRFLLVISPEKETIRKYFGDGSYWGVAIDYEFQTRMGGPGDAILCGEHWTQEEPFLVALPDCLIEVSNSSGSDSLPSPSSRLINTFSVQKSEIAVLTEYVPTERKGNYGVLIPNIHPPLITSEPFLFTRTNLQQETQSEKGSSKLVAAARWVFSSCIFRYLRNTTPGTDGEIRLPAAVRDFIIEGGSVWAVPLINGETRQDIGTWESYLLANARAAVSDSEYGVNVR